MLRDQHDTETDKDGANITTITKTGRQLYFLYGEINDNGEKYIAMSRLHPRVVENVFRFQPKLLHTTLVHEAVLGTHTSTEQYLSRVHNVSGLQT